MNYTPPFEKKRYGTYGQVQIKKIEDGICYVLFCQTNSKGIVELNPETKMPVIEPLKLKIKVDDCLPVARKGDWVVKLSDDKTKLYNVRPINGVFPAKFKEFVSQKDQPPSPTMSGGKQEWQRLVFKPLFALTGKGFEGMVVGYQWGLDYLFETVVDEQGRSVMGYSKDLTKSTHMQETHEFLLLTGILEKGPIKATDNYLPVFQRRALDANKSLLLHVENGHIKALIADQSSAFEDNSEDDGVE